MKFFKNVFKILSVLTFLFVMFGHGLVFAGSQAAVLDGCKISPDRVETLNKQFELQCIANCTYVNLEEAPCGVCCVLNGIMTLTDWIFYLLIVVSALMIIWGAFLFVTAGQDPGNVDKARSLLLYACVGLIVAFFSKALPALVGFVIGVG